MHRRNFSLKTTDSLFQLKIFKQILYFQFVVLIPRRNLTLARQRYVLPISAQRMRSFLGHRGVLSYASVEISATTLSIYTHNDLSIAITRTILSDKASRYSFTKYKKFNTFTLLDISNSFVCNLVYSLVVIVAIRFL